MIEEEYKFGNLENIRNYAKNKINTQFNDDIENIDVFNAEETPYSEINNLILEKIKEKKYFL